MGVIMKVLLLSKKKTTDIIKLKKEFNKAGFDKVEWRSIRDISLISKRKKTLIKPNDLNIEEFDAIYLKPYPKLAPFLEPFLDEVLTKDIYVQVMPGAMFLNAIPTLQIISISNHGSPVLNTKIAGSTQTMLQEAKTMKFPLKISAYKDSEKIHEAFLDSEKSLSAIAQSLQKVDSILIQEELNEEIKHSLVIGEKVFTVGRKITEDGLQLKNKSKTTKLTEQEKENVIKAIRSCNSEIGEVTTQKGKIAEIDINPNLEFYEEKTGENIYEVICKHYIERIEKFGAKKDVNDELKIITNFFKPLVKKIGEIKK